MNLFPMTKEQYEAYLKSLKWKALRAKVLKRDKRACFECRSKFNLHVHHLTYERVGNEQLEDLKTLCRACHEKQHKGDLLIKLIEICCRRFLSQKPSEDINPYRPPTCHGCDKVFEDFDEPRYHYGTTAFGTPGVYCKECVKGVREQLYNSEVPQYAEEIYLYDPTNGEFGAPMRHGGRNETWIEGNEYRHTF